MRVLVVEDDELFGSALYKALARAGHAVEWNRRGRDVNASAVGFRHDAIVVDLGLPDIAGESLVKAIRARDPTVAIIVATARGGLMDRIKLFDMGADDYLVKPFDLDELLARLRAFARRAHPDGAARARPAELVHGPLRLFPSRHTATWHERPVSLTRKQYGLLETFVRHKNQVLSRSQLEEALYGFDEEVGSNAVEVHVHHLRRKFSNRLIVTVRGLGYVLANEDVVA